MAKLIGGTVTATATPTSLLDLLVTASQWDASREDPAFIRNLTIRNASGADLLIGDSTLDSGTPTTVMLTLVNGASLAEILQVYHVDLSDIFLEGAGAVEILGLQ